MKILSKNNKGITLVALVITIVILLMLAGISISALTNTGLFGKAKEAKSASENAEKEQSQTLSEYEKEINKFATEDVVSNANKIFDKTTELHDENGSKIVVPAGFKIVINENTNNAATVEKGIVIEDEKLNQYVWIPCTTDDSKTQLQYKRTEWDVENDNGTRASNDEATISCSQDYNDNGLTYDVVNEIVAQIKAEKDSVGKNGGYYIGRYEVGGSTGAGVIQANQTPITDVMWSTAYKIAKRIGGGTGSTTYLCSSYAWDTAINFIQNNGYKNYATTLEEFNENWINSEVKDSNDQPIKTAGVPNKLKTGETTAKCNIFDMGGNVAELTTEVNSNSDEPIMIRGGSFGSNVAAGRRGDIVASYTYAAFGLRATLFLD